VSSGRIHDQCILRQLAQKVCGAAADHFFARRSLHRHTKIYDCCNLRQAIVGRAQLLQPSTWLFQDCRSIAGAVKAPKRAEVP